METAQIMEIMLLIAASIMVGAVLSAYAISLQDEINVFGLHRFVRVDAEPVEAWCEEWVCEEFAEPYCFFATPYPCSLCIEGKVPVDEDGNCPDGITRVSECVSEKFVRRRC